MIDIILLLMLAVLVIGIMMFGKGIHEDETNTIAAGAMIMVLSVTMMILTAYTGIET